MFQQDYPGRHSFGSLPSSNCTDVYTCPRTICHCEVANNEQIGPGDSISSRSLSSERKHAEYFHRPPILSIYREQLISNGSPYSFFAYKHDPNAEAEYCEQCQFCSASSKWCGRLPSAQIVKLPRSFLDDTLSDTGLYGAESLSSMNGVKVQVPHSTLVQDPLIVNAAHIRFADDRSPLISNSACRSFADDLQMTRDQLFLENVSRQSLTARTEAGPSSGLLSADMNRNPSIDAVLYANQHNLSSDSFRQLSEVPQERAQGTVHLKYYRDVRTTKHEHLAIEEGSLVISIAPYFTNLSQQLTRSDEFELRIGEVYVVSHMYADMWALCVRLRNSEGVADVKIDDLKDSPNIKFIPLCAVTLASNFSAFYRRCASYRDNPPYTRFFPAGGSLITPPRRKESLLVSRKYFTECTHQISFSLPPIVYTLCHAPRKMQAGLAYEPLDYGTESQKEETAAEAAVDDHKQQHGTLRQRFWAMFAERESKSSDKGKQPEVSPSNDGLGSGGKTIHTKSTESPPDHDHDMDAAVVKAKRPEVSQKNAGPESGGKMSHPKSTEISKDHDQDAARDDSEDRAGNATGNGNNVSKRKSVRNFFSRSMRIKNGDTGVEV